MSEGKYGRLFTEADVIALFDALGEFDSHTALTRAIARCEQQGYRMTFPADEPLFLLRGKDRAALATVNFYGQNCYAIGAGEQHHDGVVAAYGAMGEWQRENLDRVKVPD